MVQLKCDCNKRCDAKINSYKAFMELKEFFEQKTYNGLFTEVEVVQPYFVGYDNGRKINYYATKWYYCNCCNYFWEFQYPDFPANGHVRKFKLNNYTQIPYKWDCMII